MSNPTALSLDRLLLEVLHVIFYHIDIPDILQVRRVSRYLNEATRYRKVWADAYRTAEFVRPPGPFPSQSMQDLEKALITSFRIHKKFGHRVGTAHAKRQTFQSREFRYNGMLHDARLVFGQFLVVAFQDEIRCYDLTLDESSGARIIYRPTHGILRSFHCVSAIDVEGRPFTCVTLSEGTEEMWRISVYLLNAGEQSELTLDLLHQFEHSMFIVKAVDLGPRVIAIQGVVGQDFNADWRLIVLDVHTRTQFILPSFTLASQTKMTELGLDDCNKPMCISTSTHLILANSFYSRAAGWHAFFQAFTLPTPHTHSHLTLASTPLTPSHHGVIPDIQVGGTLLRDTVLDSSTQDALITIYVDMYEPSRPRTPLPRYGTLRLSTTHVARDHEAGTIAFQPLGRLIHPPFYPHRPCFSGTSRVFYLTEKGSKWIIAALEYDLFGRDSGATKTTRYLHALRFPNPFDQVIMDYDPYAGQICLHTTAGGSAIKVFDFSQVDTWPTADEI
ncbi:hypothetical protein JVT61DRAFT_4030 [Boletus reticuloceps]|uniref:F-box domain-containing protein n=1 Tax=Boletus reticuloceps TaxID=495285 RepID=A0A8I2YL34_9AGAM|nr:hypothetical protein JVT61DRAFT_4030 [Boletus reticuloceps]